MKEDLLKISNDSEQTFKVIQPVENSKMTVPMYPFHTIPKTSQNSNLNNIDSNQSFSQNFGTTGDLFIAPIEQSLIKPQKTIKTKTETEQGFELNLFKSLS